MRFQRVSGTHGESIAAGTARGLRFLFRNELGFETGGPAKPGWSSFSFPPYWFYDCLTVLDYLHDRQADRDPGAFKAVDLVKARRRRDGRWRLGAKHAGRTFFDLEGAGEPSRWNTLRAMRVRDWWDGEPIATV